MMSTEEVAGVEVGAEEEDAAEDLRGGGAVGLVEDRFGILFGVGGI